MTAEQAEEKITELKHRQPFVPYRVELSDGRRLEIVEPCLAINGGGATYFAADGALTDFEFHKVLAIQTAQGEAVK